MSKSNAGGKIDILRQNAQQAIRSMGRQTKFIESVIDTNEVHEIAYESGLASSQRIRSGNADDLIKTAYWKLVGLYMSMQMRISARRIAVGGLILSIVLAIASRPLTDHALRSFRGTDYSTEAIYGIFLVFGLLVLAGAMLLVKPLLRLVNVNPSKDLKADLMNEVSSVFLTNRRSNDVPEDLRDRHRKAFTTRDGRPVSDVIPSSLLTTEFLRTEVMGLRGLMFFVGIVLFGSLFFGLHPLISGFLIVTLFFQTLKLFAGSRSWDVYTKLKCIEQRDTSDGVLFDQKGGHAVGKHIAEALDMQVERAKQDKSKFVQIGTSTGIFDGRGDPFAPNENMPMGLTVNELSTHLLILGGTGSGKTQGAILPVLHKWAAAAAGGTLVLDGKTTLPLEAAKIFGERYALLDPDRSKDVLAVIEGLNADEVADAFLATFKTGNQANEWDVAASRHIRAVATLIEKTGGDWSVVNIANSLTEAAVKALAEQVTDEMKAESLSTRNAYLYATVELPQMPDKYAGSIVGHSQQWLGELTSNRKLEAWATATAGVDVTKVLDGANIGLNLPAAIYGRVGQLIAVLARKKIYKTALLRGERPENKPTLIVMDECQNLINEEDADFVLAMGRSLKVSMVAASQTYEGIVQAVGQSVADKFLNTFVNIICLPSSIKTHEWASAQFGKIWRSTVTVGGTLGSVQSRIELTAKRDIWQYRQKEAGATNLTGAKLAGGAVALLSGGLVYGALTGALDAEGKSRGGDQKDAEEMAAERVNTTPCILPVVDGGEIPYLLARPFSAIATFRRGGVPRRDVIVLTPYFELIK